MRKKLNFLGMLFGLIFLCNMAPDVHAATCTYQVSPVDFGFSATASQATVTVTASSTDCVWNASSDSAWATFTPGVNFTGSGTFTLNAATNAAEVGRKATLTVAGKALTVRQARGTFSDVTDPAHWNYKYVYSLFSEGITVGIGGTDTFGPAGNVSREQMAAFIIRSIYGEDFSYTQAPYFSDVPATSWSFKYVQKLKDSGITAANDFYDASSPVTREQMAAFLVRSIFGENFTYQQSPPFFSDVASDSWSYKYVQKLKDMNITTMSGNYLPTDQVSREQMAAFIGRVFLNMESGTGSSVAAKTASVAIVGLGESVLVTNQSTITVSGIAESDIGIINVTYQNTTNGAQGTAQGTTTWNTPVTLVNGDNIIKITAKAKDGSVAQISTTITYYPTLDFTTPATVSRETIYTGSSTEIIFTIGVKADTGDVVRLYRSAKNGTIGAIVGSMTDDGVLPDEIQTDGVYTLKISETPTDEGYLYYKVGVTKANSQVYFSETKAIWATSHITNETVDKSVSLAAAAENAYNDAIAAGKTPQEASAITLQIVSDDPIVGSSGSNSDGGVWWVNTSGILGLFHPEASGEKGGVAGQAVSPRSTTASSPPIIHPVLKTELYPAEYLADRSQYTPAYLGGTKTGLTKKTVMSQTVFPNEVKSKKGIIISPFIANPNIVKGNFGNSDDYFVPWQTLKDAKSCSLYAAAEKLNNGTVSITLDSYKDLSDYGYIHISSHGDNFYKGLLSLWNEVWGPNSFLQGSLSQVVVFTGLKLPKNADGSWDITGYENDLKEKRLAIHSSGLLAILPSFIKYYSTKLPNSLVVLSSCRSMFNNSLANAFLSKGAGTVVGYTDYVKTSYAQNTINTIITEMLDAKTVSEAVNKAIQTYGASDNDNDPAFLKTAGATNLVLSSGTLQNGGFEDGILSPWVKVGDGRVISQLGVSSPTEGNHMGIISTGLGYTDQSGSVTQDFCVAPKTDIKPVKMLTFDWDYFSEEFLEYCGSEYQDYFKVQICELEMSTGTELVCSEIFSRKVDDLCGMVTKANVSFDEGDVHMTGWLNQSIDISSFAGKKVKLKFYATDVGDSIYDTAILIDNIKITEQ